MPFALASPSSHWKEISSCRTWSRSCSYSCLHWVLSCESVTLGWPLAGFGVVLRLVATHSVNSGGLGTEAFAPCPLERAATLIQWSYCDFSIVLPSTSATALPGTPPHPAASAAGAARAARASVRRTALIMRKPKSRLTGRQGSEGPARGAGSRRFARPRDRAW